MIPNIPFPQKFLNKNPPPEKKKNNNNNTKTHTSSQHDSPNDKALYKQI
jgi:hypothetical protein